MLYNFWPKRDGGYICTISDWSEMDVAVVWWAVHDLQLKWDGGHSCTISEQSEMEDAVAPFKT